MKKLVIVVILILSVCSLGIYFYLNNRSMSSEEYVSLMHSFRNISNVKIENKQVEKREQRTVSETSFVEYIKDGKVLLIRNENVTYLKRQWSNSKTKESIMYDPELKEYAIIKYKETDDVKWEDAQYKFIRI